jgi:hypothetical protein
MMHQRQRRIRKRSTTSKDLGGHGSINEMRLCHGCMLTRASSALTALSAMLTNAHSYQQTWQVIDDILECMAQGGKSNHKKSEPT